MAAHLNESGARGASSRGVLSYYAAAAPTAEAEVEGLKRDKSRWTEISLAWQRLAQRESATVRKPHFVELYGASVPGPAKPALKVSAHSRPRMVRPPGSLLLIVAELFASRRSMEEIYRPTVEDMRLEYWEALQESRTWKARIVHVRGVVGFLQAAGLSTIVGVLKSILAAWKVR